MDIYAVKKLENINTEKEIMVSVPGSKSITNRALLIAAMANGTSRLKGCLASDDARYFLECLKTLGFPVEEKSDGDLGSDITITGFGGEIPNQNAEIYVGSAGTAARFLVAMLAFSKGCFTVKSSDQMKKRPMQPLVDTLRAAGAKVECLEEEGHFPFYIEGIGNKQDIPETITVNIDKSSQFLSALLIAAGTFGKKTEIEVVGNHGLSYVDLTAEMMRSFGVTVDKQDRDGKISYVLSGNDSYHVLTYDVEPDMSAAAYFYAMAAITGAKIAVKGVTKQMLQGDTQFLELMIKMGCQESQNQDGYIELQGPTSGALKGNFTIDMSAFSDQALTLAAIAPFADGTITITGIGHIRLQECDRIEAMAKNLQAMGIAVEKEQAQITIHPGIPNPARVDTFEDHRVAMSFALTGLLADGIVIENPMCCSKTFAQYFDVLDSVTEQLM